MSKKRRIISGILIITFIITLIPFSSAYVHAADKRDKIVVSLGDSYSSGEGVEDFYGQELSEKERAVYKDFLAHRSKESWPGKLIINGKPLNKQKCTQGNNNTDNEIWYFEASSGAETNHLKGEFNKKENKIVGQEKKYNRNNINKTTFLDPQLDVFKELEDKGLSADYVTMTIGGNDVGFGKIITTSVVEGNPYLCPGILAYKLNKAWRKFYEGKKGEKSVKEKIRQAYKDVRKAAGENAIIIVAGYPKLVADSPILNPFFTAAEAKLINKSVSKFNEEIQSIIEKELNKKDDKIYFVSVEKAFEGSGAYSSTGSYLNPILMNQKYDIKEYSIAHPFTTIANSFSDYSMHPNKKGTDVYAECVQRLIDNIELEEKLMSSAWEWKYDNKVINLVFLENGKIDGDIRGKGEEDSGTDFSKWEYYKNDDVVGVSIISKDINNINGVIYNLQDDNCVRLVLDNGESFELYRYSEDQNENDERKKEAEEFLANILTGETFWDSYSQRAHMQISDNNDGTYSIVVNWASGAEFPSEWTFVCSFDAESLSFVCNNNGTLREYDNGDWKVIYNNNSARIVYENNYFRVISSSDSSLDNCRFENVQSSINPYASPEDMIQPIVDHYMELWKPEGNYVIFESEIMNEGNVYAFFLRYQMSEAEEQSKIDRGLMPLPNVLVGVVTVDTSTGTVSMDIPGGPSDTWDLW